MLVAKTPESSHTYVFAFSRAAATTSFRAIESKSSMSRDRAASVVVICPGEVSNVLRLTIRHPANLCAEVLMIRSLRAPGQRHRM